jgi:hypothetical protein
VNGAGVSRPVPNKKPAYALAVRLWGIIAMAVFYLSIRIGDEVIRDPHTYDFPTAQDARDGAIHAVHELIVANPDDIEIEQREIEIADATGHAVTVVSLREVAPWRG